MKWFKAETESGTTYSHTEEDGSLVKIVSSGNSGLPSQTINVIHMTVIPAERIAQWINDGGRIDWEWLRNNAGAEVPVVGAHLFVSGFNDWRLSTPIVKVEEK